MKRFVLLLVIIVFFGLNGCAKKEPAAIVINNITVPASDFTAAFNVSPYVNQGEAGKMAFLESYVTKKLILSEAERMSLDRDPEFLSDIQNFWEQGLLKRVLLEKNQEFAAQIKISEDEIRNFYDRQRTVFQEKALTDVHSQIQEILEREKQNALMKEWVNSLNNRAKVAIDYQKLGMPQQPRRQP
jgi:hypothetical protein